MSSELRIRVGEQFTFIARLEEEDAPLTCAAFSRLLPFQSKLIHARWSGEATWIPLGNFQVGYRVSRTIPVIQALVNFCSILAASVRPRSSFPMARPVFPAKLASLPETIF